MYFSSWNKEMSKNIINRNNVCINVYTNIGHMSYYDCMNFIDTSTF